MCSTYVPFFEITFFAHHDHNNDYFLIVINNVLGLFLAGIIVVAFKVATTFVVIIVQFSLFLNMI